MERITKIISIALFFTLIFCLPIMTLLLPKEEISEIENRELAELPEVSVENYLDKTLMKGLDEYVSDHFAMRTNWMTAKTTIEQTLGKYEFDGVYLIGDRLVEKLEAPDETVISKSIDGINNFAAVTGKPCFVMIVPTSGEIYREQLPKYAPQFNQKEFIDDVYYRLNSSIATLDAYSPLYSTRDEYIFYRTDHHWTSLGAYYAYASTIIKMGYNPVTIDKFDIEHANNSFLGTLYSQSLITSVTPDTIDFFTNRTGPQLVSYTVPDENGEKVYDTLYMRDYLNVKDKYSSFTGSNKAYNIIKTDIQDGEKILVIKDSYANCYMQFLTQHFSEITMVDLRYITPGALPYVVDIDSFDKVLFLYNASSFATDENLKSLSIMK